MSEKNIIKNRSEILFLYDCKWMNPNGDPLNENKPRIDEETGINYVTDVRLKRTVRDYLADFKEKFIFIKENRKDDGELKTKEILIEEYKIKKAKDLLQYVDIRLFGSTTAIKKNTIVFTGPVQFNYGRSLHRVKLEFVRGTTVMPSKELKKQGTFTENYVLPYSLIAFHGIVNENAAKYTNLTDEDVKSLMEALWNGTKNLITRSKFGQTPRLLLQIQYKEEAKGFYIGDFISKVSFTPKKGEDELAIRDISEGSLDISELVDAIQQNKKRIKRIIYKQDPSLNVLVSLKDVKLEKFDF